jgi:hypothetical protein
MKSEISNPPKGTGRTPGREDTQAGPAWAGGNRAGIALPASRALSSVAAVYPSAGEIPWRRAARKLAGRLALGYALEATSTPLVAAAAALACSILLMRTGVVSPGVAFGVAGGGLSAVVALGWRAVSGRRAELRAAALARLDAALGCQDRLLAAAEGAVPWPPVPEQFPAVVHWRWRSVGAAPAIALAVLAAAWWLPVAPAGVPPLGAPQRPPVFDDLTQLVEELRQDEAVSPAAVDQLGRTLDELLQRESASLYSHGSLEAAARLLDQTAAGASELSAGLVAADAALTQLSDASDAAANREGQDSLAGALRSLEHAALPVSPMLAGALRDAQAGSLSPQQRASLSRQLRNACSRPREGKGSSTLKFTQRSGTPSLARDGRPGSGKPGQGKDCENGGPGDGNGGVSRGPGHPPLALASEPTARRDGRAEAVETADRDQAGLGELISESAGAPRTDPLAEQSPAIGGTLAEPGRGADAVRIDELTPDERRAVRRFFQ